MRDRPTGKYIFNRINVLISCNLSAIRRVTFPVLLMWIMVCTLLIPTEFAVAQTVPTPVVANPGWQKTGLVIKLRDQLKHPKMNWPLTRIQYRLDLSADGIQADRLQLMHEATRTSIPFQLSDIEEKDGLVQRATLHFLSDLDSGADHAFRLLPKNLKLNAENRSQNSVVVKKMTEAIELSNGLIRLQLPQSGNPLIAPVAKLGDATQWLGKGAFSDVLLPVRLNVTESSVGPVMAEYHLAYQFKNKKKYNAVIRLVAGMDFFEIEEEMQGFSTKDSTAWHLVWDNFKPAYRFCPNRPGSAIDTKKKGYDNFAWEPVAGNGGDEKAEKHPFLPYDQQLRKGERLPFQIVPYDNWLSWWNLPTATFWSASQNTSLGLFVKDLEKWNDGKYALWGSAQDLSIYFTFADQLLRWHLPLTQGTRSTGISIYPHQKDVDLVNRTNIPLLHTDFLRRWYGWLSLDKIKNWTLDYEANENTDSLFFVSETKKPELDIAELDRILTNKLANISENSERNNGPTPVGSRDFNERVVPLWYASYRHIPVDKMKRLRAAYLFMSYVFMDETLMPVKTMLSGHPNFLADIKAVPGMAAALFHDHPQAQVMADDLEKSVALNLRYHVRPTVTAWNATGGRWTENLGTYTWAFLKPTLRATYLLHHYYDGRNRILQPNISLYGGWLLNGLTSPLLTAGGKRVNPPQGAHAHGLTPSNLMRMLGQELYYYDPLLAEHLLYVTSPDDRGFEYKIGRNDPWGNILQGDWKNNRGTNPRLRSAKYTGYGFTLRKNFGEANETYVHLQQIDDGPNYRWGRAGQGGNGIIYYYANGKRYSHNGIEDVGDAPFGDVERCTNFGVKKTGGYRHLGAYRGVGRNDLTEPLFDFGHAQFAQINANEEAQPEYISRSVLQSGDDYIVIFDHVKDRQMEGRFSWFTGKEDDYPNIFQLSPGAKGVDSGIKPSKSNYHNDQGTLLTKGRYYDGKGSFLTLVTHKDGIAVQKTDFGCTATNALFFDRVFRSDSTQVFMENGMVFHGTAGIVRHNLQSKSYDAALFQGREIGIPGLLVQFDNSDRNGISISSSKTGHAGLIRITEAVKITFTQTLRSASPLVFYLNGSRVVSKNNSMVSVQLSPGDYNWQWTAGGLVPARTKITGTVYRPDGCEIVCEKVTGATGYQLEVSYDTGNGWKSYGQAGVSNRMLLKDKANRLHVRVLTKGSGGWGQPSADYPVYLTDKAPEAPEGLLVVKENDEVKINWGQILGVMNYKLYRSEKNVMKDSATLIYAGPGQSFNDQLPDPNKIYEYRVTAENKNGVSEKSTPSDTDPSRLINWYPKPGEIFRRDTRSHENGYDEFNPFIEEEMPILSYPTDGNN